MKIKSFIIMAGLLLCSSAKAQDLTVIDDLASYTGTDATVFSKADGNVYKYNSMGQYEKYGVYEVVDFAAPQVTEVEYITNAANSDLFIPDYRPKSNTRVFATVEIASTHGSWRCGVFGTREYSNGWPNAFYFETVSDSKVHAKLGNENDFTTDGTPFVGVKSVFDLNGSTGQSNVYVDGKTIASATWTKWTDGYDYKYFLSFFAVRQNNTSCYNYQPESMKLYGAKIYEGSTLVMDLVPVVTSAGKGGLKDRLTGSVYTNGNGTISASGSYSVADASKGVATYEGKLVYNTADNNMYRWNGSAWENKGTGLAEISDTKYYRFYDNSTETWNWSYPGATFDGTFAGYKTDVSATYGSRANHNEAQIGAGGFEPLMYAMSGFENGANYRLSFDFTTGGFNSWDGGVRYLPLYLYAGSYNTSIAGWGYASDHINDAYTWAYVQVPFNAQSDWHIARNFTANYASATFIFQFGAVNDGGDGFKFWFDNIYIQKYLYPATYPAISLTEAIETVLAEAKTWTETMTTDALWSELSTAVTNAETYKADADLTKQKDALDALQAALDNVKAAGDITYLRPTITLAKAEGIDTSEAEAFASSGTTTVVPVLNALRVARQVKAKGHHDAFTGAEPTVGETYYLYNVGQGLFLCPSMVGAHELALGFAGDPLTLEANGEGYQLKGTIRADKYIGHQWGSQGFFDGGGNDDACRWFFFPVEGQTNIYNISKADNTNNGNLLGYAPEATPTYGIGERDGSQDWGMRVCHNRSGVADAKNQWMFVTKAERDALLASATADNGVDATYYIVDPAIDHGHALQSAWQSTNGSLDVWGDWIQYAPADANLWIADADVSVSQEITGLKPGLYGVSVQSVYMHPSDFSVSNAELFATNGNGETFSQTIAARLAALDQVPGMGVQKAEGWLPAANRYINYWNGDGANGAAYYFHYGQYWNEVKDVLVGDDGKLTIGVKKNAAVSGDAFVTDNFRLTYYGPLTKEVNLTNGYATFSAAESYKVTTEGVSAYKVTEKKNSYVILTAIEDIPANTGVVLYGEGAAKAELEQVGETTADVTGNMLKPHVTASVLPKESDGCKNYLLALDPDDESACVFRPSSGKGELAAGRAYLALPIESNGVKYFVGFEEDDATAISLTTNPSPVGEGSIYNLAGQRLEKMQKGVNIVNGKKILK